MDTKDCLVCRKHRGELPAPGGTIYEDDLVYASHVFFPEGRNRVYRGWLVLEPKRHAPGLPDLTDEEARHFGLVQTRLGRALVGIGAEHVYALVLGHHVPHLHLHLLPRYPNTPREYRWPRIDEWPEAQGDDAEIAAVCERIREQLQAQTST